MHSQHLGILPSAHPALTALAHPWAAQDAGSDRCTNKFFASFQKVAHPYAGKLLGTPKGSLTGC
jgi:hypothetical protein